jgi:hypothetical protein
VEGRVAGAACEEREIVEGGLNGCFAGGGAIISGSSGFVSTCRRYAMHGRSSQSRWLAGGS